MPCKNCRGRRWVQVFYAEDWIQLEPCSQCNKKEHAKFKNSQQELKHETEG